MTRRRGSKSYGTPTGEPQPQAIDSWSGFKVNLADLKKQWDGNLTVNPDRRNSQDFVRGIKDDQSLPYSRPEPSDVYVAGPLVWQDGTTYIIAQDGINVLLSQGTDPVETL